VFSCLAMVATPQIRGKGNPRLTLAGAATKRDEARAPTGPMNGHTALDSRCKKAVIRVVL
jgi:hypothetical protein